MLKAERHQYIMDKLLEEQKVVTSDLALALDLSEDTVRRDLNELDSKKLLKKVYGGAISIQEKTDNIFSININAEEQKKKIVTKALPLLHDGQVIIMSGGTTNLVFARLIPEDLKVTIYTYSLPIAMQLSQHPNIDLIFIGGKMQKNAMVTIGMDVVQVLSKIKADICFIGASSININQGLTEIGYEVSIVKKAMIEASDKVVSMFSSNKLNTRMPHVVCELSQLDTIVTELETDDPRLEEYKKLGVNVV
ncbi:DeoR/GlpR family DNA-binding transcription regulator [Mariniflexile maritimum]|jgi:DeoR/GlpR family transcriptional regulator of sugar metabolism|uniref:DeoR/GlpR family DNA-binding transcription regulator n=1 Tax=Mariniflexile maritimum TaxID=2682493 RepID=UPI0012F67B2A|nr:DeoR/GlpR family DNA-binding transcription regulator [Mariniflexile maritimum]HMQ44295.1 DeoR/GlpR family DNA-binding transcription regulator [Mariniflexile sp.]HMR15941.1 DeoR/GlpR family DNA-binding transcription regulator [Mariniflexile sp.]